MMKAGTATLALLLATLLHDGYGAEALPSAEAIVATMRQARLSDGFELRLSLWTTTANGHRSAPVKLAVIGQFTGDRQRVSIRGISPDAARHLLFAAQRDADGRVRAVRYGEALAHGVTVIDSSTPLFDSGLVIWDLLSPWWDWPRQEPAGQAKVAGRDCAVLRSRADAAGSRIREVVSCVDGAEGLSMRTELFDANHGLVRRIAVERAMRKASGAMFAKRLTITAADDSVTEVEVYGGDEHYRVGTDTFAALDADASAGKPGEP